MAIVAIPVYNPVPPWGTVRAGIDNPVPAWMGDVGEWTNMPDSQLSTSGAGWTGTSPGGTGTYLQIMRAWGGGCLNTVGIWRGGSFVTGIFKIIFGGGHGDYAGNEVMAYGPLDGTPTWSRITDPTIPAPDDVGRLGGYPVSRHTYDTLVYLPTQNKMLCIGAPGYFHTGSAFNQADVFDFAQNPAEGNPWSTADTGFPAYAGGGVGTISLLSGYDSESGKAWGVGRGNSQRIGAYDSTAGTWQSWAIDNPGTSANVKAGLSPSLELMAFTPGDVSVVAFDLRSTPARFVPTVTGTAPPSACVLDWDEDGGRFVGWAGSGKTLYFLTPGADPYSGGDDWAWTSTTPAGGDTPATQTTNGTFGRFRLVKTPGWRGVALIPTDSAAGCFYRMS